MKISEHISKVKNGEIDILKYTEECLSKCENIQEEFHYFTNITKKRALIQAKRLKEKPFGKIAGVFISIKDCICLKGENTQSSSRILEGYKPIFDADFVEKIEKEGGIIIGKTVQDEFGFGGFSTQVGLGFECPLHPIDKNRVTGGSSGGAGGLSKVLEFPHVAIGESTGGSIVSPAALCGVYGLCPTYGLVSRYGLLDYGNSLDKIGPLSNDLKGISLVLDVIRGKDSRDSTSMDSSPIEFNDNISGVKIGIIKESLEVSPEIKEIMTKTFDKLRDKGAILEEVSLPNTFKYGVSAYYIIAQSESSTNLARYCGMRYGKEEKLDSTKSFNEYFSLIRSKHFGKEAKRRIMIGTFARMVGFRDAYYMKALKVRTKIINEYKDAFKKYDLVIGPTLPFVAPTFDEVEKMSVIESYMADKLTVGPNVSGMPHISIPVGEIKSSDENGKNLPVGLMGIADHFKENILIKLGGALDDASNI